MKFFYILLIVIMPLTLLSHGYLYPELVQPFDFESVYESVNFSNQLSYEAANPNIQIRGTQNELSRHTIPINVGVSLKLHASDFYSATLADTTVVLDTLNLICDFKVDWGDGNENDWVNQSTMKDVVFHNKYWKEGNNEITVSRRITSTNDNVIEFDQYTYDIEITSFFSRNSTTYIADGFGKLTYNQSNNTTEF